MSKYIKYIPLSQVERVQIYINKSKKTLAQIKKETGADFLMNGGLFEGTMACCPLKADGSVLAVDAYTYFGYGWNGGADICMARLPDQKFRNYISCVALIKDKLPLDLIYNPDVGGSRQRTAMGLKGGDLCLYCTNGGVTPEGLRGELVSLGWDSALMLDGGGSSQCDFQGEKIIAGRKVHNLILAYLKKGGEEKPKEEEKPVGPGVIAHYTRKNPCYTRNERKDKHAGMLHSTATPGASAAAILDSMDSPTAGAAVEYAIDPTGIYQGLPLGVKSGHCGASANSTHVGVELCEPEETIFLPINWKPLSQGGKYNRAYAVKRLQQELVALGFDPKGVDGSFGPGCAAAVKAYQKSVGLGADGSVGPATLKSLQKREGSRLRYNAAVAQAHFDKVYGYAVELFAWLMKELDGRAEEIVCHSEGYKLGIASNHADVLHWFPAHGKSMDTFRADVKAAMAGEKPGDPLGEAVDKLASKGVIDSPDYWKGGFYSAANVQALLIKVAAAI